MSRLPVVRPPLPHRAVEALDVSGLASELGDGARLGWRNNAFVDGILIRVEYCLLPIHGRQVGS